MKKALTLAVLVLSGIFLLTLMNSGAAKAESTVLSTEKQKLISDNCSIIKDNLKNLQHEDSKVRVHLGKYYETILANFITPLNVVLVANNVSNLDLIENQNEYTTTRAKFASDYIVYQKALEELVAIDCKVEPGRFYDELIEVRAERKKVSADVTKLRSLIEKQKELVTVIRGKL